MLFGHFSLATILITFHTNICVQRKRWCLSDKGNLITLVINLLFLVVFIILINTLKIYNIYININRCNKQLHKVYLYSCTLGVKKPVECCLKKLSTFCESRFIWRENSLFFVSTLSEFIRSKSNLWPKSSIVDFQIFVTSINGKIT